jgi:hypothetical protein
MTDDLSAKRKARQGGELAETIARTIVVHELRRAFTPVDLLELAARARDMGSYRVADVMAEAARRR